MSNIGFRLKELVKHIYYGDLQRVQFDNCYSWIGYTFQEIIKDPVCARKPPYIWGVVQGAALAKVLNIIEISVIEFGVAGGAGLISLEKIAQIVEEIIEISIKVFGFDSGIGHPNPIDYRDQPNMWFEGQLPMNRSVLERFLEKASLRIGMVGDTVPLFISEKPSPIGFISFDLDLYSSTKEAMGVFNAPYDCLLPRVISYFDDVMGHSYSDFTGERLAICEFNQENDVRKLSAIYGLKYFVPPRYSHSRFWDSMYFAHFFEHPLYITPDSIHKGVYTDAWGGGLRAVPESNWRSQIEGIGKN